MSYILEETLRDVIKCPKCGREFFVEYTEQTPGFRFPEDLVCPYCKEVLRTSMEYEFHTYEKNKEKNDED